MANYVRKTAVAETEEQTSEKKTAVNKAASEKPAEKKAVKKRASRKTVTAESNVYIQFFGKQVTAKDVVDLCQADYKSNNRASVKNIDVYVKPEEDTAYYVVNGDVQGKVSL